MTATVPDLRTTETERRLRYRRAMGAYASGVTVVATELAGRPVGATCQAFHSVSLEPPLISLALSRGSATLAGLQTSGRFGVQVLAADQEHLSRRFGRAADDKWAGLEGHRTPAGLPRLPGALLSLDCRVHAVHRAGDHDLVLGLVDWFDVAVGSPLLFYRGDYHELTG